MHIETQTKSPSPFRYLWLICVFSGFFLSACSFVELQPGAQNIIFAKPGEDCTRIETFEAEVKTRTLLMKRDPRVIAEELQTLAQNHAYQRYANAIWPTTDVIDGKQNFEILNCEPLSK